MRVRVPPGGLIKNMSNTKLPSRIILTLIALVCTGLTASGGWLVKDLYVEGYTIQAVIGTIIIAVLGYVSFDNIKKAVAAFKA